MTINNDSTNAYCWGYASLQLDTVLFSFGTNNDISLDTVGHEYMHAIEQRISTMDYQGLSGAIMEGYSDIFGELVEDWQNDGLDGDCDWIHGDRNISNPHAMCMCVYVLRGEKCPIEAKTGKHSHNDNYTFVEGKFCQAYYPSSVDDDGFIIDFDYDNGGVHHNSTVISHTAYLMTQGSKNAKLTTEQLAKLWYHTLYLLPTNCDFVNLRECMEIVAKTNKAIGLTEKQQTRVSTAFEKAGISPEVEKVNNDFQLCVLDQNDEAFNNCSVKIEGTETDGRNKPYSKEYASMENNPWSLLLENGKYTITITNNDTEDVWVKQIQVKKSFTKKEIIFSTAFLETDHTHTYAIECFFCNLYNGWPDTRDLRMRRYKIL